MRLDEITKGNEDSMEKRVKHLKVREMRGTSQGAKKE